MNLRPSGYEPDELPGCSTPRGSYMCHRRRYQAVTAENMRINFIFKQRLAEHCRSLFISIATIDYQTLCHSFLSLVTTLIASHKPPMRTPLIDSFGREITYLRLSVTDRCDLRCTYCMAENMTFLPRKDLLSLEELDELCSAFIERGIRKIRLTGGEPLVRRDLMGFIQRLSRHRDSGALDEITMTTNGTQLAKFARDLKANGVERINISLDTLKPDTFLKLTRRAALDQVKSGIDTALEAGLKIKINTVALKGTNDAEIPELMMWAHGRGMDMTLIEVMPLGEIEEDRVDQYIPLTAVRDNLAMRFTLTDTPLKTGGPARYVKVEETGGILGLITPAHE